MSVLYLNIHEIYVLHNIEQTSFWLQQLSDLIILTFSFLFLTVEMDRDRIRAYLFWNTLFKYLYQ